MIIAVSLLFCAFVLPYILRQIARAAQSRLSLVTEFYRHAPALIANRAVSAPLASVLNCISDDLDNPRVARNLFFQWVRGNMCNGDCRNCEFRERRANSAINALPAEIREKYLATLSVGLISLTYAAPFSGFLVRRMLFHPVGMPHRTQDATHFAAAIEGRGICSAVV